MELSKTDIKKLTSALDIQRFRRTRRRKFPQMSYVTIVDKFFAHKPVTLTEMNEICATEASRWAYVESLLQIFPTHAALALEGTWNGETMANGMMLAHVMTKATIFLPIEDFSYVFASVMRQADDGGISFVEVARSLEKAKDIDDKCHEIFTGWISDVIGSREHTLDVAMHTAGERFFAMGSSLIEQDNKTTTANEDQACMHIVKELLLGDLVIPARSTKRLDIADAGLNA